MKKLMVILLSLSCLLAAAACGKTSNAPVNNEGDTAAPVESTKSDDAWGIKLEAKNVTAQGMTLTCTQHGGSSEGRLETGSEYWIEKREASGWVRLEPQSDPVRDMMAHLIPSGETVEWKLDWSWLYGELGEGKYRICKTISDFKESGASEGRHYCAEFEIK